MSNRLTGDASFSSRQELLNLNEAFTSTNALENPASSEQANDAMNSGMSDVRTLCTHENSNQLQFVPNKSENLCGWSVFKPKCLQVFNTPKGMLFFLCGASFLQGLIVNGFINTVITSIERRFDLRSYHSGMIASSYDIAACICLTFVSYFGGYGHKPRWLGWGVLIMALGSVMFTLPHFTSGHYEVNLSEQTGLCLQNQTGGCDRVTSSMSNYRFVFMFGQFLHGIGATPLYTLGVTYLDENVKSNYAPVYISIFYTAAIVGPAAGYLLGGFFLQFYTEINTKINLTPDSPLWVGAWWIGFLGAGGVALLVAIPILGYPRQLPGSQRFLAMRVSEAHQLKDGSHMTALEPNFGKTVKDLPRSALLLLRNPTFIFLCFSGATEATLMAGMSTFGPKFLESQFNLSASQAATLFGFLVVPAGGGGTFLGGFIINKLKLRCAGIIKFCLICTILGLLAIFIVSIHCSNVPMAGITYNGSFDSAVKLTTSCNAECKCLMEIYNPVCGADKLTYYSPCHAGCTRFNMSLSGSNRKTFYDCSCVMENSSADFAESGKCPSNCPHQALFLAVFFLVIFFTFLGSIPAVTATLRCVPESQKSFALGIQWIVVRTLGGIPGPIAFGSIIDLSCLLWQDQCGERGSCYIYQNSLMSKYLLTAGLTYKILGSVFFLTAWFLYKPPSSSLNSSNNGESSEPVKETLQRTNSTN
ncbi:solute carrier organic anion transporter family member 4A1 [Callorhinchus milii]|uniref:solute carrier organic anion transporter family member 4A1 n=1 Tax=Callorhinchus milii TaxID=7868 RepID=UPI0004574936|nr:solute carrier organic anion transporter family member 4A1 [Callorhinchus milii]XP_007882877.1 solute carrier organic anion transporter family member 4A1 [Callorhinchus milii]XP_007882884.1 solute carrier organic anion transporter family member 4A1 [Callorhinchus milii]XP_042197693.1 solute carrier organic anion transporter family member 4A1 [Callorhinchus milii]XP_042197694.1 solute carrier organic anion transporter family member 4A1 [Callorhinchus milii]XP_042197695.1 solute carrier organ|eukprot:gi/632939703/ref/XP_007882858.1/ PREDICTED: solute carrier organic anion transporter family member 4A1 [Callorhinchus milii]